MVCIRRLQVRQCGINKDWTRLIVRGELVDIVNEIQMKCWPGNEPWRLEEIDFLGFVSADGRMEGMVTLARREKSTVDQDLLVGTALAMMMGSGIPEGSGK